MAARSSEGRIGSTRYSRSVFQEPLVESRAGFQRVSRDGRIDQRRFLAREAGAIEPLVERRIVGQVGLRAAGRGGHLLYERAVAGPVSCVRTANLD